MTNRNLKTGLMASITGAGFLLLGWTLAVQRQARGAGDDENIRLIESIQGPALYQAYCAVCHGTFGKGDGPMGKVLKTAPPDLTRIAARNGSKFPSSKIQKIILGEDATASSHGTRAMPIWGPIFSQVAWDMDLGRVRVDNLARYLESIQSK